MNKLIKSGIFWTVIVGVIGIFISIAVSNKSRKPSYYFIQSPVKIFNSNYAPSSIEIIDNNGNIIEDDIYTTTIGLFNRGSVSIKKEDIRIPFKIIFADDSRIFDFKITSEYPKSGVGDFKLMQTDSTKIGVLWSYFDPNFAIAVQITYSSKSNKNPELNGYVLGNELKKVTPRRGNLLVTITTLIIGLTIGSIGLVFNIITFKSRNDKSMFDRLYVIALILGLIFMCLYIGYKLIWLQVPVPIL